MSTKSNIVADPSRYEFNPSYPTILDGKQHTRPQPLPPEPSKKAFLDAFLGRTPAAQVEEILATTRNLQGAGSVGSGSFDKKISVQSTQLKGASVVKCGLGVGNVTQLVANPAAHAMILTLTEGFRGAVFPDRVLRVPVVGCVIATRGDAIYAEVEDNSGLNIPVTMSLAIIPEALAIFSPLPPVGVASSVAVDVPFYCNFFTVDPLAGVLAGDTVDVLAADGTSIAFSAFAGRQYPVSAGVVQARYVAAGPVVPVLFTFWTFK